MLLLPHKQGKQHLTKPSDNGHKLRAFVLHADVQISYKYSKRGCMSLQKHSTKHYNCTEASGKWICICTVPDVSGLIWCRFEDVIHFSLPRCCVFWFCSTTHKISATRMPFNPKPTSVVANQFVAHDKIYTFFNWIQSAYEKIYRSFRPNGAIFTSHLLRGRCTKKDKSSQLHTLTWDYKSCCWWWCCDSGFPFCCSNS